MLAHETGKSVDPAALRAALEGGAEPAELHDIPVAVVLETLKK